MNPNLGTTQPKVDWKQVGIFIGLTFGCTYLLDLLLPALFAILVGLFVFSDSPFYYGNPLLGETGGWADLFSVMPDVGRWLVLGCALALVRGAGELGKPSPRFIHFFK